MNSFDQFIINNFPHVCQSALYRKSTPLLDILEDLSTFNSCQSKEKEYKIYEEENKIIFKCLSPCYEEKDFDIKIDNKSLEVKSNLQEEKDLDFNFKIDKCFKFKKEIDPISSYAKLDKGVLTIVMPLKEEEIKTKIKFI